MAQLNEAYEVLSNPGTFLRVPEDLTSRVGRTDSNPLVLDLFRLSIRPLFDPDRTPSSLRRRRRPQRPSLGPRWLSLRSRWRRRLWRRRSAHLFPAKWLFRRRRWWLPAVLPATGRRGGRAAILPAVRRERRRSPVQVGLISRGGWRSVCLTCTLSSWPPFACAGRRKSFFFVDSVVCSRGRSRLWAFWRARATERVNSFISLHGAVSACKRILCESLLS